MFPSGDRIGALLFLYPCVPLVICPASGGTLIWALAMNGPSCLEIRLGGALPAWWALASTPELPTVLTCFF